MLRIGLAASLVVSGLVAARGAHASWLLPPAPYRPKDFSLVKKDGVYHIFFIRRDVTLPGNTERDFGHAVSTDLYHWTMLDPVLTVRDSSWDNQHVWAPSILLKNGVYYMFYTGVTNTPGIYNSEQRIGVATSTDLLTWNRMDEPVFSCDVVPWTFCDSLSSAPGFRDPFVMADPSNPGRYLMYYTATADSDSASMVVGVASSDGDLARWNDLRPLWATYHTFTGSGIIESPHAFEHDGLWYLFFTTGSSQPIAFLAGPDPLADPGGWPYYVHVGTMLGFNTIAWFASEHLRDGLHDYLSFVDADRIEVYEMTWQGPARFGLMQPDLFHVVRMDWAADSVAEGEDTPLVFVSVNGANRGAEIEAFAVDSIGGETPAPLDSLGLPSLIPMSGDTTRYLWSARRWPSAGASPTRLVVRMKDLTAVTPSPVTVRPDTTFRVTALRWTTAQARPGDTARFVAVATNWTGRSVSLAAFVTNAADGLTPAPLDSLGLPAEVPLVADTTKVDWSARVWPSSPDSSKVMRLLLRLAGGSPSTGLLRVGPDSVPPPPDTAFRVTGLAWKVAKVRSGDVAPLCVTGKNMAGRSAPIEAFERDSAGAMVPVPLDSLDLPPALELTTDSTLYEWTARRWMGARGPTDTLHLVIRLSGDTLQTGPLAIAPDSIAAPPDTAFRVTGLAWKLGVVVRGQVAPLCVLARHAANRAAAIAVFTMDGSGALSPAPLDSMGLPPQIPLAGDSTAYAWTSRTWPDSAGLRKSTRVVIRAVAFGVETAPLVVRPDSTNGPAPVSNPGGQDGPSPTEEGIRLRSLRGLDSSGLDFLVELKAPISARIDVFDVMGRRVRNLADRILPAGASVLRWDGRAADGSRARAGIYFARLTTPRGARVTRTVLLP